MSKTATKKSSPGLMHEEGAGRSNGSAPQLLSQLPGSVFTSPGFVLGIVAVEIVYGLFLFVVMSTAKRQHPPAAESYAAAPRAQLPPPAEPSPTTAEPPEPKAPEPAKADASPKAEPPAPPKAAEPPPAPKEDQPPAPPVKKKSANRKKRGAREAPKAVALAPTPKPEPAVSKEQPTVPPLGPLIDPLGDCRAKAGGDGLTISVPPGLHILNPQLGVDNAPRALAEVNGDFLAEVRVPGEIRPGSDPVKGLGFTFQGAGLLLWQDKDNYVRFERTVSYAGETLHRVFIESYKDGKPGKGTVRKVSVGPVSLRLERKGRQLIYSYTTDGKTWIKLDQSAVGYAPSVSVGISATNASTRKFDAQFTDFVLKRSS